MRKLYLALAVLVAPLVALANGSQGTTRTLRFTNDASTNRFNLVESIDVSDPNNATSLVATLPLYNQWSQLKVNSFFDKGAATSMTLTLTCSSDGVQYAIPQSRAISSGTATLSNLVDSKTLSGDVDIRTEYGVAGCWSAKVTWAFGGTPDPNDILTYQITAVVGF